MFAFWSEGFCAQDFVDSEKTLYYLFVNKGSFLCCYSEIAEVHKHYFCIRAAGTGFYIFE